MFGCKGVTEVSIPSNKLLSFHCFYSIHVLEIAIKDCCFFHLSFQVGNMIFFCWRTLETCIELLSLSDYTFVESLVEIFRLTLFYALEPLV